MPAPAKNTRLYGEINKVKKGWSVIQALECPPSKNEALSSSPSTSVPVLQKNRLGVLYNSCIFHVLFTQ
jgi:hypothetical protein